MLGQLAMMVIVVALLGWVVYRYPINGWPSLLWVAPAVVMTIIRIPFAKQTAANSITEKRAVGKERALLALVSIGGTYLPLLHLSTDVLHFANYAPPIWVPIVGGILLVPALYLFWRSHADLGRHWSVTTELHADQTLVTSGVYQRVRHPMYAAIWLLFGLQPFFIQNWIAGFSGLVSFGVMYAIRVPVEEQMMRDQFGEEYVAFCERAGRLWPKRR